MIAVNPYFDKLNDKLVGAWIYKDRLVELYRYKKDANYVPTSSISIGTKGGKHKIVYVYGAFYIRVQE